MGIKEQILDIIKKTVCYDDKFTMNNSVSLAFNQLVKQVENHNKLLELCKTWREKYKPSCPESIQQVDEINLACPELVEEIFELIGWYND